MTYIDHGTDPEAFRAWLAEHRDDGIDTTLGAGYRGKDRGTGHEVYAAHLRTHVPCDVEPGMDPGLFA